MAYDFRSPRLFVRAGLSESAEIEVHRAQSNYLLNVLRLRGGDTILAFNGRDGEWRARVEPFGKRDCRLLAEEKVREQTAPTDLHYLFAPLKRARLDYMVEKAVEMGAAQLRPVITRHTQVARVNLKRMEANAIEAAEQCGVLTLPEIVEPAPLAEALAAWDVDRRLIFCDEAAPAGGPVTALKELRAGPVALLVGPEGGFSDDERTDLLARPYVTPLSLGPRILRADTAAVAALALVQAFIGDWR